MGETRRVRRRVELMLTRTRDINDRGFFRI